MLYLQNMQKKLQICKIMIFFDKIQLECKNVYKKMPKKDKIYVDHAITNMQKCLCKICAIRFLMFQAFQKAKNYPNLTTESGSKQRFSLLQEKAVIQAVCLRPQAVSNKARFQA